MTDVIGRVDAILAEVLRSHRVRWTGLSTHLDVVFDELDSLVFGGGKRLRPQFCYLGWVAVGGELSDELPLRLGAAVELLHVMALLHDDVIDNATTRRGNQATHHRQSQIHRENALLGEARRFGEGIAVLIGDITYVISDELTIDLGSDARRVWNELRLEMNIGQYLDTIGTAYRERSGSFAELVCRYKSAKYTIERPLHLGAIAANVSQGQAIQPMLSAYGLPLGEAFQIRDDILGVFGEESTVGKPVGGDLREGKPTPMLAHAYEHADSNQIKILEMVGQENISAQQINQIQLVLRATGAPDAMETKIDELVKQAVGALDAKKITATAFEGLNNLAEVVTQRNA